MLYDLIVVGSGPAGSSAAIQAARCGLNTLLIDQAIFPRDKTCAGGLTTAACNYLPEPLPIDLCQRSISGLSTWLGNHQALHSQAECFMKTISRAQFDSWLQSLAAASGVSLHLGDRALGYELRRDGVAVRTRTGQLQGRMIIGADGANSIVARQLRRGTSHPMGYCLQMEVPAARAANLIEIHYGVVPEGYGWVFPHRESQVIGVGGVLGHFPQARSHLLKIAQHHAVTTDAPIDAHTIPIGGRLLPVSGDGVLLVGDAAGFVDPFTGEGIRYALQSGQIAADTARHALLRHKVPLANHLLGYDDACRREIMPQLRYAYHLSRAFFRFSRQLHPRLFGNPEPVEQLLDVLRGKSDYPHLTRWMLRNLPKLLLH
ncbi:MAG: geranylgeranyl reductase family protein [Bacillota bacterium]